MPPNPAEALFDPPSGSVVRSISGTPARLSSPCEACAETVTSCAADSGAVPALICAEPIFALAWLSRVK